MHYVAGQLASVLSGRHSFVVGVTVLPNKGMNLTKPAQAMELRSLSPVFVLPTLEEWEGAQ